MFSVFIEWGGGLVKLAGGYASHDAAEWAVAQWMARHGVVEAVNPFVVVADGVDAAVVVHSPRERIIHGVSELDAAMAYHPWDRR